MTTVVQETVQCGACAHLSRQSTISSTNSYGPADLDGRPAPMARQAIMQLQECPNCGSIGTQISYCETPPSSENIREQLAKVSYNPELARYAQAAIQSEVDGYLSLAKRHWIMAAWAADDLDDAVFAKNFRNHYVALALETQKIDEFEIIRIVDALRRSRRFGDVIIAADRFSSRKMTQLLGQALKFEQSTACQKDTKVYNFDDVRGTSKLN